MCYGRYIMKISIIGHGFVGKAVEFGFTHPQVEIVVVDPIHGTSVESEQQKLWDCEFHFVCVPTPQKMGGHIDDSILKHVVDYLLENTEGVVIIKSTVTPQSLERYDHHRVAYNPEFLQERSALADFVDPDFHIIGSTHHPVYGLRGAGKEVQELYERYSNCNPAPFYHMNIYEASFVKYGINTFLATKVTFFNQLFDAAQEFGNVNFSIVSKAIGSDPRIGLGHTKVPGFDMKKGYGGACFPKDVKAFKAANTFPLLDMINSINNDYRRDYDLDDREKQQNVSFE